MGKPARGAKGSGIRKPNVRMNTRKIKSPSTATKKR